jgi:hypothetical protein
MMVVAVLMLMALMMTLALVISMLGARWPQVVAALLGAPLEPVHMADQAAGASGMRALMRA